MIELDFNIIKFIFFYIQPELFNNIIINHYKIKDYISKKINSFERYFDLFIKWRKSIEGPPTGPPGNINSFYEYSKFENFYDNIISKIKMPP
jgi:hypothetical protein